ncbi:MAG: hypothetical protein HY782_18605 [Chloroflexi bacterium]|nr:hypothetical protein [Chloroflexota bacterium]
MPATATSGTPFMLPSIGENPGSRKVMMVVHGAGHFAEADLQPVADAVAARLGRPINFVPVVYADVMNPPLGRAGVSVGVDASQEKKLQDDLEKEMTRDAFLRAFADVPADQLLTALATAALPGGFNLVNTISTIVRTGQVGSITPDLLNAFSAAFPSIPIPNWLNKKAPSTTPDAMGGLDLTFVIKEVCQYLANANVQSAIQTQVKQKLDQAALAYDEIVLVSHSLGTVVTFDVLHDCADQYAKVTHWFTLGCPLVKVMRIGQRRDLGKINYGTVKHWFNIYDSTDLVANALGPSFCRPEFLLHDIFVDIASDPLPSHDYFTNPQTLEYIAAAMR